MAMSSDNSNAGFEEQEYTNSTTNGCDLRILNAIRQIIRATDIDSRRLAANHGITSPQLMCLMAVVEKGELTAVDIAERVHLSTSTLVGVLDRLEAKGLIRRQRSTDDRREVDITPTEEGQTLVARTPFPLQHTLDRALQQLTEKEQGQIADWMERLVDLMEARQVDAGPMLEIVSLRAAERRLNEHKLQA